MIKPEPLSLGIVLDNEPSQLRLTLDHLLESTFPPGKIDLLIGNHSECPVINEITTPYKKFFRRLRVINFPPFTPSGEIRNTIIEKARGKVILFLDHHILPSKDLIAGHLAVHKTHPGALVSGYIYGNNPASFRGDSRKIRKQLQEINRQKPLLENRKLFRDMRTAYSPFLEGEKPSELSLCAGSFRLFSTANLSGTRADLINLGGFDENYLTREMADYDLAYRFLLYKKQVYFTPGGWGFQHLPQVGEHSRSEDQTNFFSKYPNRETELFYCFAGFMDCAGKSLEKALSHIPLEKNPCCGCCLPAPEGSRLGLFVTSEEEVENLQLTQAFMPLHSGRNLPRVEKNCTFWSLLGMQIPLKKDSIREGVIPGDLLMFLDKQILRQILPELGRVCERVYCLEGKLMQSFSGKAEEFHHLLQESNIRDLRCVAV